MDAILYVDRTGIPAPRLPTLGHHLRLLAAWRDEGVFIRINGLLRHLARTAEGCTPEPSACIIDAQSVKTST
nr:hypothetical protein [Streptosporangium roseum]